MLKAMKATSEAEFFDQLGKRIVALRKERGLTQEKLAAKTGLDRVAIAYIETGKRTPRASSLYKIAVGLEIDINDLFKDA